MESFFVKTFYINSCPAQSADIACEGLPSWEMLAFHASIGIGMCEKAPDTGVFFATTYSGSVLNSLWLNPTQEKLSDWQQKQRTSKALILSRHVFS